MSWQTYVDVNLVGSGKVTKAAILGQAGGVWASSHDFILSPEEQAAILKAHSDPIAVQAGGLRLGDQKYFTLQADPQLILLKKGADGATIVRTKQAIIVGVYQSPLQSQESAPVVVNLAEYLSNAGF